MELADIGGVVGHDRREPSAVESPIAAGRQDIGIMGLELVSTGNQSRAQRKAKEKALHCSRASNGALRGRRALALACMMPSELIY